MEPLDEIQLQNSDLQTQIAESQARLEKAVSRQALFQKISKTLKLEDLLQLLAEEIELLGVFDGYLINLIDRSEIDKNAHEEDALRLVCEYVRLPAGYEGVERTYRKYRFTQSLNDSNIQAFNSRSNITVSRNELENLSKTTQTHFERWNISQMICAPIKMDEGLLELTPLGTIALFLQQGEIGDEVHKQINSLILIFYKSIANALEHELLIQREQEIEIAQQEHTRFLTFVTAINNLTNEEHIYELISKELLQRFPFDLVGVLLEEDEKLVVKDISIRDLKFNRQHRAWLDYYSEVSYDLDVADGASSAVFIQNAYVVVPDVNDIRHLPMSEKDRKALELLETPHTFLFVPIRQNGKSVGLLWLLSLEHVVEVKNNDIQLIELLGTFIGNAISNSRIYTLAETQNQKIENLNNDLQDKITELHDQASKDRLTGLLNYGTFVQELQRRVHEFKRLPGLNLSMIFFDVDRFKKINDRYGHIAGNEILQELANRIKKVIRKMDIACRYGGEEFAVILPRCDIDGAYVFAERVRQLVAEDKFNAEGVYIDVTISVGCVKMRPNDTSETMIERADKALYKAKKSGRNRTVLAKA